ncbi:MAG: hypothetical protein K1W22_16495 [Lachnospiraceae bacterium]
MKVPVRNQSTNTMPSLYSPDFASEPPQYGNTAANAKSDADRPENRWTDTLLIGRHEDTASENSIRDTADNDGKNPADTMKTQTEQASDNTGAGSFKVSCSLPDDSTGQLAAMLARAETKMDVQQVSSKAVRALSALKMASVFAEGDDAKKAAQRIRRMEKLMNRISKKQQQLNKEEVLELQRKSAEKRKEMKRVQELKKELDNKRTKRRRDERNYAAKEIAQDEKEASQEMFANMPGASSSASIPLFAAMPSTPGSDLAAIVDPGAAAAELSMTEGVSLDITV